MFNGREKLGPTDSQADSQYPTDATQGDRLNQELKENVMAASSYCHADAYLTSAFGNAHQHNIHYSDAAYQQRYARDSRKEGRHRLRCRVLGFGQLLLVSHD